MLELHGYRDSVYSWIVRLTLHEKGVDYRWVEVDPFALVVPQTFLDMQPFCRVPVLVDGDFQIFETCAITRYLDEAFDGPPLQPTTAQSRARQAQIVSIIDSYGYWPLVRQVFVHGWYHQKSGEEPSPEELATGLAAAPRVLGALERLAAPEGVFLLGALPTLADLHAFPVVDYFAMTEPGADLLGRYPKLAAWHTAMTKRETVQKTRPHFGS
ncbi:MAG: glutathione S-transferase family protein [Alphaproteobacteria bacterium]|nr:glutathione S-transferase family protein [Alphaproteobacteria bacterium]